MDVSDLDMMLKILTGVPVSLEWVIGCLLIFRGMVHGKIEEILYFGTA